jgi:ATP-dependent Clp protease ATP-binding subunit ClpA
MTESHTNSRLTNHARQILKVAESIAETSKRPQIKVGDIILSMLLDSHKSVAQGALIECGLDAKREVDYQNQYHDDASWLGGNIKVSELLAHTIEVARSIGHHYGGPEHIVLALCRAYFRSETKEYFAARSLTATMLQREVHSILGTPPSDQCLI